MIADQGSAIIKRYGLLNETIDPQQRAYGIPHPGTFIVDRSGRVSERFFEESYRERFTAASILIRRGLTPRGPTETITTRHLRVTAAASDAVLAPGERLSLVLDVAPKRGMHVYAPGTHTYRVVRLALDAQPWLRAHDPVYPPSEIYHFRPLDERVEVYAKPFRLVQDLTILGSPEAQKLLASETRLTVSGQLEYQACDDKVCYTPLSVPVRWTLELRQLDRK